MCENLFDHPQPFPHQAGTLLIANRIMKKPFLANVCPGLKGFCKKTLTVAGFLRLVRFLYDPIGYGCLSRSWVPGWFGVSGVVWAGLGRSRPVWAGLGVLWAGLGRSRPVWAGLGPVLGFGVVWGFWGGVGWSGPVSAGLGRSWGVVGWSGPVSAGLGWSWAGLGLVVGWSAVCGPRGPDQPRTGPDRPRPDPSPFAPPRGHWPLISDLLWTTGRRTTLVHDSFFQILCSAKKSSTRSMRSRRVPPPPPGARRSKASLRQMQYTKCGLPPDAPSPPAAMLWHINGFRNR
jgi:hypothetical protein